MIFTFFVNKSWRSTYIRGQKLPEVKRRVSLEQKIYDNCRFSADLEVHSPQQRRCGSTGKQPAIGNYIYFQTLGGSVEKKDIQISFTVNSSFATIHKQNNQLKIYAIDNAKK